MRPSPGCFLPATRKKLFELARAFSEKTKMRKSKRKHLLKHQVYPERGWGAVGQGGLTRLLLGAPQGQLCGWSMGWEGRLWCHGHILAPQLVFLSGGRRMGTAASTANLLDDVEGHAYGKECCATLCWVCVPGTAGSRGAWPHIAPRLAQV